MVGNNNVKNANSDDRGARSETTLWKMLILMTEVLILDIKIKDPNVFGWLTNEVTDISYFSAGAFFQKYFLLKNWF